jgi:hypothetical protein
MKKGALARLDKFLPSLEVDKVGVVSLEDHKDTPLWDDARKLLPNSKAVVVLALEVFPEVVKYLSSKRLVGEMALRDLYGRNTEVVNGRIDWEAYKTVKTLHDEGFSGLSLTAGGAPYEARYVEGAISYVRAASSRPSSARGCGWPWCSPTPRCHPGQGPPGSPRAPRVAAPASRYARRRQSPSPERAICGA